MAFSCSVLFVKAPRYLQLFALVPADRYQYGGRSPGFKFQLRHLRVACAYSRRALACPSAKGDSNGTHVTELSGSLNDVCNVP